MSSASSSSWVAQIMQPGGGVLLLPLVRFVISLLLICTVGAAVLTDVARIHMIVLSTLAAGLLVSLQFFESELHKARRNQGGGGGGCDSGSWHNYGSN
jgi:hypothetical protein